MKISNKKLGFTLIELLVVIAIIGILSAVVLASLNSARNRGIEAAIKSDLRNMVSQAELSYVNNYSSICASLTPMITAIGNSGGSATCYTNNNPAVSDVYLRWGATTKKSDGTKNWSVDSSGAVVTWDTTNSGVMTWAAANTTCAAAGGKLASLEELKALYDVYAGTPTGFTANDYWTNTSVPSDGNYAYAVYLGTGSPITYPKTGTYYVRCVR